MPGPVKMTIKSDGLEAVMRVLGVNGVTAQVSSKYRMTVLHAMGTELQGQLADCYPQQKHVPMEFVSDKQRRWFFAALRNGEIEVPYKRTRQLSRGWETRADRGDVEVVNPVRYAAWVMGRRHQTSMMKKIGWPKVDDVHEKTKRRGVYRRAMSRMTAQFVKKLKRG